MKLVVGCPVRDRAWIIHRWFEHTHNALRDAGVAKSDVTFVFVGDQAGDSTFKEIDRACLDLSYSRVVISQDGPAEPYERVWGWDRYLEMAQLRNSLLDWVRRLAPDLYWSLDSDILVARNTLTSAVGATSGYDAVGSRCYMTPSGVWCPSYAMLPGTGGLLRSDSEGIFGVDVIMAAKLMTKKAYCVDYVGHKQGEDIGWSIAARKAGCRLGWDGTTVSKHVMSPKDLDRIDGRCGF